MLVAFVPAASFVRSLTQAGLSVNPPAIMRPRLDSRLAAARALQAERKVRLTFPEALARQLGVATPPLPSVEERKKRALQYAEVRL